MISVIILAGGIGSRMKSSFPKQLLPLGEKLVLHHSLEFFLSSGLIDEVIVVLAAEHRATSPYSNIIFANPGLRRQDSLANGFAKVSPKTVYVLVHDGARPFIKLKDLEALIKEGQRVGVATLGVPLTSTIREVDQAGIVTKTLNRESIWEIQTPQFLRKEILAAGLEKATAEGIEVTDDVALAALLGHKIQLVRGSSSNFKITNPEDLSRASAELLRVYEKI